MPENALLPEAARRREVAGVARPFSDEVELVLCCARSQLDEPHRAAIERLALRGPDWEAAYRLAERNGVLPLFLQSLRAAVPGLVPPEAMGTMERYMHGIARKSLLQAQELVRLLDLFKAEAIPAIPLKGVVLAEAAYGRFTLRQTSDLDILIRPEDLPRAERLLLADAYGPQKALGGLRKKAYVFFNRQSPFVRYDTSPALLVELHTGLSSRGRATRGVPFNALLERAEMVTLLGRKVPHLATPDLLPYLCRHAGAKHDWYALKWICDVAEVVRSKGALDWKAVFERTRALHEERSVLFGLFLARECLGAKLPPEVTRRIARDEKISLLAERTLERLVEGRPLEEGLSKALRRKLALFDTLGAKAHYLSYWAFSLVARRLLRF